MSSRPSRSISSLAALGIFFGGGAIALQGAVSAALHPAPVGHYAIAYVVLAVTLVLDGFALEIALRPLRRQAKARGLSLLARLQMITDPASKTVVVGGGCGMIGGIAAATGLFVSQQTGSATPDTVASAAIGLLLLTTSALLFHMNRGLLSGQGLSLAVIREMRAIVAAQPGVIDVPDLFAIIVGPASLVVNGDIVFADDQDVPEVELAIMRAAAALRRRWPAIDYVYLTPVG